MNGDSPERESLRTKDTVATRQHKDLRDAGYAPGNYSFKCMDCDQEAIGDKRARRCRPCAEKRVVQPDRNQAAAAPPDADLAAPMPRGSLPNSLGNHLPPVLDACCGPRMFWFDREDPRALFIDKRRETHRVDVGTPGTKGRSPIVINPDHIADFTNLPFADSSFYLVVFDPPHIERKRALGAVTRKFGVLNGDWRGMLRAGFAECFRVLKPHGVLVFKWGESDYPVSEILKLAPAKPLFGHKTRKTTHWCVFLKEAA